MIYYENGRTDPFFNLAAEEFLLTDPRPDETVVLLWRNEPTVVVGRNQNTAAEVNLARAAERRIKVVRRLTGGGAVYHDLGNLNYSILTGAAPGAIDLERLARPVRSALEKLGVPASFSGRNDILVETAQGPRKISGAAQRRFGDRLLHHGTLLFDVDFDAMASVLTPDSDKFRSHAVASVKSRVMNLAEISPGIVLADFFDAFLSECGALESVGGAPREIDRRAFSAEQIEKIVKLRDEKYATWEWNVGKSPAADFSAQRRFPWGSLAVAMTLEGGKIAACRFTGDFFAQADPETVAQKLVGIRFDSETLRRAVSEKERRSVWPEMTREEWSSLFFDRNADRASVQ